jgi:uncharacterized membrane protein YccC
MSHLKRIFEIHRDGIKVGRGLAVTGVLAVPLIALSAIDLQTYWLSVSFAALFVALSDPGGPYATRVREMAWVALLGALLTALGYILGAGPWGWVVVATFAVTLLSGLALKLGVHRFVAGSLLNYWFLIALSVPATEQLKPGGTDALSQALAWLVGSGLWIAFTLVGWLARGRVSQASHIPEIPGDMRIIKLTRPMTLFAVIRAAAVGIAVAIAFGLHLPDADWMPVATLVAMKSSVDQATLVAVQRVTGAVIGAVVAAAFLLTVADKHALEVVIVLLAAFAASFRIANYALYCAAVAGAVLIGMDLPHPSNLSADGYRVLFTFIGVGIGVVVMLLASMVQTRSAKATPATT